jgi:hypothetical protein
VATRKAKASSTRNKIDFDEISDWREFEELVADYFRVIREETTSITDVQVRPTGVGSDGGRDILVSFRLTDYIDQFERRWVVQCKFHQGAITKARLASVNIPTLIHEYGADGYLLICKGDVTAKVSEMFENLQRECRFGYSYRFWTGDEFKSKLLTKISLIQRYFPEYYEYTQSRGRGLDEL